MCLCVLFTVCCTLHASCFWRRAGKEEVIAHKGICVCVCVCVLKIQWKWEVGCVCVSECSWVSGMCRAAFSHQCRVGTGVKKVISKQTNKQTKAQASEERRSRQKMAVSREGITWLTTDRKTGLIQLWWAFKKAILGILLIVFNDQASEFSSCSYAGSSVRR